VTSLKDSLPTRHTCPKRWRLPRQVLASTRPGFNRSSLGYATGPLARLNERAQHAPQERGYRLAMKGPGWRSLTNAVAMGFRRGRGTLRRQLANLLSASRFVFGAVWLAAFLYGCRRNAGLIASSAAISGFVDGRVARQRLRRWVLTMARQPGRRSFRSDRSHV
jgi:hypothetical protein